MNGDVHVSANTAVGPRFQYLVALQNILFYKFPVMCGHNTDSSIFSYFFLYNSKVCVK